MCSAWLPSCHKTSTTFDHETDWQSHSKQSGSENRFLSRDKNFGHWVDTVEEFICQFSPHANSSCVDRGMFRTPKRESQCIHQNNI